MTGRRKLLYRRKSVKAKRQSSHSNKENILQIASLLQNEFVVQWSGSYFSRIDEIAENFLGFKNVEWIFVFHKKISPIFEIIIYYSLGYLAWDKYYWIDFWVS